MKKKPLQLDSEQRKKQLQSKILELYREIIGGLRLQDVKLPENLEEGQDRIDFAQYCHRTYHDKFFQEIVKALYFPLIMHMSMQAKDPDEMAFNRATPNGVMLMVELFQKWANIYDQDYSANNQKFDPNASFEPTTTKE